MQLASLPGGHQPLQVLAVLRGVVQQEEAGHAGAAPQQQLRQARRHLIRAAQGCRRSQPLAESPCPHNTNAQGPPAGSDSRCKQPEPPSKAICSNRSLLLTARDHAQTHAADGAMPMMPAQYGVSYEAQQDGAPTCEGAQPSEYWLIMPMTTRRPPCASARVHTVNMPPPTLSQIRSMPCACTGAGETRDEAGGRSTGWHGHSAEPA